MIPKHFILLIFVFFTFNIQAAGLSAMCAKAIYETVILIEKGSPKWTASNYPLKNFSCIEKPKEIEIKFNGIYYEYIWIFSKSDFSRISQQPEFKRHSRIK